MGLRRKHKLAGVHPDLIRVVEEASKYCDIVVLEGVRDITRQKELVEQGRSKTMNSMHLIQDDGFAHAVDIFADPIEWESWKRNYLFAGYIKGIACSIGVKIRCGADWDGDFHVKDQTFHDLPHFEIKL